MNEIELINNEIELINNDVTKQEKIVSILREAVASGDLPAGARLPIRTELETQFNASRMTVQKALDQLARDGYTNSRGKLGTFITDYPPCLCRFGIVFSDKPQDSNWSGYHEALRQVGHELGGTPEHELDFYFRVSHEGEGDYGKLLADIQSQRLAGILFADGPWYTHNTPIVQQDRVPCMAVMSPNLGPTMQHVTTITFDGASMYEAAIATLVDRGCRRPAVLIGPSYERHLPFLRTALLSHDLPYSPSMLQGVSLGTPTLAEHVMALWMQLPADARPDGIYIADDNLVEHACSGLLQAGVHPGVDMPVVVHCNFPTRAAASMPLDRVGYDIRTLVRKFIDVTSARRRGEPFEKGSMLTALHEYDLEIESKQEGFPQKMAGVMV